MTSQINIVGLERFKIAIYLILNIPKSKARIHQSHFQAVANMQNHI